MYYMYIVGSYSSRDDGVASPLPVNSLQLQTMKSRSRGKPETSNPRKRNAESVAGSSVQQVQAWLLSQWESSTEVRVSCDRDNRDGV